MKTTRRATQGQRSGKELGERLRAHRFRLTPQRAAVYWAVTELGHASPRQIHERVRQTHPMLSLNTVYAALDTLERVGQILGLTGPEGSLLYEATAPSHHHFHCFSCRRVLDIQEPALDEIPLPVFTRGQFTVTRRRVEFYGYCPRCRRRLGRAALSREAPTAPAWRRTTKGARPLRHRGHPTRAGPK